MPEVIEAIRAGKPVILPTDTVYGLCTTPYRSEATERLYRLKGREATQPTAMAPLAAISTSRPSAHCW